MPISAVACSNNESHGQGKDVPAGYRAIILYRKERSAFFIYGFAKKERNNLDDSEMCQLKKAATYVLGLSEKYLALFLRRDNSRR